MTYGGLSLNMGSYYGCTGSGYNRTANSYNQTRVARDMASSYTSDFENINYYLRNGETDAALDLYADLKEKAAQKYSQYGYSVSDAEVSSALSTAFSNATGNTFEQAIDKNTSGSFLTGVKEGILIIGTFFANGTSEAEARAELSGRKISGKEGVKEVLGGIVSGVASGAAIGAGLGLCGGPFAALTSSVGAIGGAVVGGIVGAARTIIGWILN